MQKTNNASKSILLSIFDIPMTLIKTNAPAKIMYYLENNLFFVRKEKSQKWRNNYWNWHLKGWINLEYLNQKIDETLGYFEVKISDHRQVLQEVFPEVRLHPNHHYVEHYPALLKCFEPLLHVWTMRFEAKHRFFTRVVHGTQNFKIILKTIAIRHQHMMAYHLGAPLFFKPKTQASRVDSVLVSSLPEVAQVHIKGQTTSDTVYQTSKVTSDGTDYVCGMFLSVGVSGGLSRFSKIEQTYLVNYDITFLCSDYESWYEEHLRFYELSDSRWMDRLVCMADLNDTVPFSAYKLNGSLLLTPKRFILVKQTESSEFLHLFLLIKCFLSLCNWQVNNLYMLKVTL